ncbi:Phage integrase [Candidatus Methylobacter favarea]|uniref:Phage integrase n=1 Tax=Candidatus Methylobacter favarea TaxID=2707345 RepID=A0A8S0WIS8_9GAMM|nr:integrase [Candidatus Methylobacter favarea]CAA9890734.1 Phage integrase [Candidatus Methylobacter favarea]
MKNYLPPVEIFPDNSTGSPYEFKQNLWSRSPRLIIFAAVFLISAAAGLTYNYSRPAVYRSSATLLTSAMTAIDRESSVADIQHVAIQRQILLGHELVVETLARLKAAATDDSVNRLTASDIRSLLNVEPVAKTNLVEVLAEGTDPEFLPVLINTWIDVYLDARAAEVKKSTDNTSRIIEDELKGLTEKINAARTQLQAFRKNNDISSTGRNENEALARLKGLTDSLNRASEEEVKAKAHLDAIRTAIAANQTVVPEHEQRSLQDLEKRLQELRERLAEFDKKFTRDYLNKQPALKFVPEQIEKLEAEVKKKHAYGKNIVLTDAENKYAAAKQSVIAIRAQLDAHKKQAADFTSKFAEHEALKTDLEGLEKLYRDTQQRLVQIETGHKEKYPQVTVISRAYLSQDPIGPDYSRDAGIAIAGSLLLGLFSVWIFEFLTRKHEPQSPVTLAGIHMYNPTAEMLNYRQTPVPPLEQAKAGALESPSHRELSSSQLKALLKAANLKTRQFISLLLCGLSPEEAASLKADQIDMGKGTLTIPGSVPRVITLNRSLKSLFEQSGAHPVWTADNPNTSEDLAASLLCAALDSGLPDPIEITAEAIRHSYIAYLVRQGLRLSDLEQIVGYLEPVAISNYNAYSPPQQGRAIEDIELFHPALIDIT